MKEAESLREHGEIVELDSHYMISMREGVEKLNMVAYLVLVGKLEEAYDLVGDLPNIDDLQEHHLNQIHHDALSKFFDDWGFY